MYKMQIVSLIPLYLRLKMIVKCKNYTIWPVKLVPLFSLQSQEAELAPAFDCRALYAKTHIQ